MFGGHISDPSFSVSPGADDGDMISLIFVCPRERLPWASLCFCMAASPMGSLPGILDDPSAHAWPFCTSQRSCLTSITSDRNAACLFFFFLLRWRVSPGLPAFLDI